MWLFLLLPLIFPVTVKTAFIQKYILDSVSDSKWVTKAEYSGVSTMAVCTMIGYSQEEYYSYSHDAGTKVCQLGQADLLNSDDNGDRLVTYKNIPYFGMVQGNKDGGGDPSINIILPNGKVCLPSDHGIPDFDLAAPTYMHGLVEHQGVIYKVAGETATGKQTASYKLDLHSDTPVWENIAPILTTGRIIPKGGLVGHEKHLFLVPCDLCPANAENTLQMYDIVKDTWTGLDSSLTHIVQACPGVAAQDNFLYIIMGKVCDVTTQRDTIQVLDMNNPTSPTRVLAHKTAKTVSYPACTFTQLDGNYGILCAGGHGGSSETKKVQFIPIENGYSTGDGYFLSETLGLVGANAFMINFGNGQLAFYGGLRSGEYRDTVNLWDPETKAFIHDETLVTGLDSSSHAGGLISTEYVKKKCWKHL